MTYVLPRWGGVNNHISSIKIWHFIVKIYENSIRMRMRTTGASKNRDWCSTKWLAFSSWANLVRYFCTYGMYTYGMYTYGMYTYGMDSVHLWYVQCTPMVCTV